MFDADFQTLSPEIANRLLDTIENDVAAFNLPKGKVEVRVASLPFYGDFKIYALVDTTKPEPNTHYMLYKPGDVVPMNWTNEPIYSVNERAPIKVDRASVIPYAKFFFHFVRGQLGRFIIVEKPEEVNWLPDATEEQKKSVAEKITPVTYKGIGRDSLYTLTCTVVFKNALFKTDIKIAPHALDVFDAETKVPEHFTIGQMKLTNEDLLLEDLSVPIDPPPTIFG